MNEQIVQQITQLVAAAQQGDLKAIKALQDILAKAEQGDQQATAVMLVVQQIMQLKQSARHGAKLNYLKSLKNQCAEDEELYYFKKGGSVGCGCRKKMQNGGPAKKKPANAVDAFKGRAEKSDTVHVNNRIYATTNMDGSRNDKRFPAYIGSQAHKNDKKKAAKGDRDAQRRLAKLDEVTAPKNGAKLSKNCNGAVAKFKKHRLGGNIFFK